MVVWVIVRGIIQGCLIGIWVGVGCCQPTSLPLAQLELFLLLEEISKSPTLWGNEAHVATTSVEMSFGKGCSPGEGSGRGEGLPLSFPSAHEKHHGREKLFQRSVLHPQGGSLLFLSLVWGEDPAWDHVGLGAVDGAGEVPGEQRCSSECWLSLRSANILPGGRKTALTLPARHPFLFQSPPSWDARQCPKGKLLRLH